MPAITRNQRKNLNKVVKQQAIISNNNLIESHRPHRKNIKRVDYTGMDSIEPVDEFDTITNIWADVTTNKDSDYEFEDDEDEDEYEEYTNNKWAVIHPSLNETEKSDVNKHINNLVQNRRSKRNINRVDYSGMDMSDDTLVMYYKKY